MRESQQLASKSRGGGAIDGLKKNRRDLLPFRESGGFMKCNVEQCRLQSAGLH